MRKARDLNTNHCAKMYCVIHLKNPKIRDKCMVVCLTAIHLSLILGFFQMSVVPRVFWPTALKLGCMTSFDMLFLEFHFFY